MTTPTNDRQTSERERLAEDCERSGWLQLKEVATQLRADEAEIEALQASVAALRAENEALRTGIRAAIQSFIRSKESRRG